MYNLKTPASLEEKALIMFAIARCQANDFKETVLCLEKPVYGTLISCNVCNGFAFVSDPEKLAEIKNKTEDSSFRYVLTMCCSYDGDRNRLELWDRLLEVECQKLMRDLPITLRHRAQVWMNRIALEYLSYCRRQEAFFGLSRYFLMDFVTSEDWNDLGRLDEERLAERLVKDERLTVLQRYRIACVYCLGVDSDDSAIAALWKQLTAEEKASLKEEEDQYFWSKKPLVSLWSYLARKEKKITGRNRYLRYAIEETVKYGNKVALKSCWRLLDKNLLQDMAMKMACKAFRQWFFWTRPIHYTWEPFPHRPCLEWREYLMSDNFSYGARAFKYNLPFYYSDLLCFFLSEMSEPNQLNFYKKAFQDESASHVLECFLEWPHQDYFLPTIRKLWDILPQFNYGQCLLILASKYSGKHNLSFTEFYTKEDCYYDYQSLLFELWEETPEDYRRYVFTDKPSPFGFYSEKLNAGRLLLPMLILKYPFTQRAKDLSKIFFNYIPKEERIMFMHSEIGKDICVILTQTGAWSFYDWVLKEFLPEKEIPSFKKQFIQSHQKVCFDLLQKNLEKKVEEILNWYFESTEEKNEFKKGLIYDNCSVRVLCREMNFPEIERMMAFCLPSEAMKKEFKTSFTENACCILLMELDLDKANRILDWGFDSDEQILVDFLKIDMFFDLPIIDIHYDFILKDQWDNVKRFYKWFDLSDKEIKDLKEETIFSERFFEDIAELLFRKGFSPHLSNHLSYLLWCLREEQIIFDFRKKFESIFSSELERDKRAQEHLDHLIEDVLSGLKNDTENKRGGNEDMEEKQIVLPKLCDLEEQTMVLLNYMNKSV